MRLCALHHEVIPGCSSVFSHTINTWVSSAVSETPIVDSEDIGVESTSQAGVYCDTDGEGACACIPVEEKDCGSRFQSGGYIGPLVVGGRGKERCFAVNRVREDEPSAKGGVVQALDVHVHRFPSYDAPSSVVV